MKKIIFSIWGILLFILGIKNTYAQVYGIDVSHYQGTIDWNAVANDGKVFAWVKATDGRTYTDSKFLQNMTNGQAAGVVMGAYHFARPISNSATSEANHFLAVAGNYIGDGFLPPVLDLEDPNTSTHLTSYFTSSQLTAWVQEWMDVVESHTGVKPVIYTSGSIADYLGSSLTQYGLWIADPDGNPSDPPTHIGHWNTWVCKQYSWSGVVSGINTNSVDLDVFHGSTQDFYNFISANTDPPENDECANAITLQSSETCNPVEGTVNFATHDNGFNPGSCDNYSGTPLGAGVFYKFVATHTTHTITVNPQGDLDAVVVLYHGNDCNSLQEVACVDAPGGSGAITTLVNTNLIVGDTYYIRVYDYGSVNANNGNFTICLTNPGDTSTGIPENDECANAILLQSSSTCNPIDGTVNDATHDNGFNPGSCDNYSGTPLGAGVFYKFVATHTQHTITVDPQGDLDAVLVLYHGNDCNSLQEVACIDAPGGSGATTTLTADNLTVGDMYYIRVYDYGSVNTSNGDFSICVTNPDTPTGPQNDECANAISLQSSVNCNPIDGTVNNATHDNGFNPGSCDNYSGTPLGAGVFYKFVATHTTHTITVDPQGDLDAIVVLYHGSDCNSLQEVACVDAPGGSGVTTTLTADNLVPGETYYIRVYDYGSVNASNGDFSICVTNPDTPSGPPNDECANAITLQSSVNCNPIDGTVNNATHDNGFNSGSCDNYSGTPLGAGVFYQFIATHTTHTITVDPQGDLDAVVVLYHGNDCNSLQEVACVDAPGGGGVTTTLTADNLTIGDTYYIRVYDYGSVNASNGDFSICVTNPNTPSGPQNDECANAITLQSSVNCNPIDGTVNNATHDNGFNPGSCDNYSGTPLGAGVFYKFVATNTQHTITVDPQGDLDAVLVLYHGTDCNSLQEVACMDAPGGSGVITTLTADNLTVGDTYYIRVYDYGSLNASNGDFSICVTNPSSTSTEDISLSGCELLNGNSFNQGSQVIVQATQNYEGNSTTIPPVFLYYYLSDDCTLDSNDVYLGSSVSNVNANNTSETETDTLTLPANLQSGNYNILFVADATNVVDEVSENNNIVCKPITILGNNTQDIYLSSLYLDNAILSAGGTTNAEVNVNYISNSSSSKSVIYVNYYLSQDDILDSGDVFLAENYVNITDNNMTKKVVTPLTVPLNTSDGIYYVIAKADPFNNYFETNEDNNTVLYQLQVENSTYSGLENTYGLKIYPNPAKDLVAIESNKRIINITVFNNNGKEVLNVKTNSTRSILDLNGLSNGNYLVKIKFADNNQIIEKIIKN